MLWDSSAFSEFRTSLSKVLTLWHYVKVKQRYLCYRFFSSIRYVAEYNSKMHEYLRRSIIFGQILGATDIST